MTKRPADEAAGVEPAAAEVHTDHAIVYPVAGCYLAGVPAVPTIAPEAVAARLVSTGAFGYLAPEIPADGETPEIPADGETPEITVQPLPESALAALEFYAPIPAPSED